MPIPPTRPRSPRRRLAIAALACTAAVLGSGAVAQSASAFEIAVQDDSTFLYGNGYPRDEAFAQARDIGATVLRVNVIWADWVRFGAERYDSLVDQAAGWGMKVHFTLMGTPKFYDRAASRRVSWSNPSAGRTAVFARDVSRHFKGRVARYSIWNEPNLSYFLEPQSRAPRLYRNLYRAAYQAIKAADPAAQVLYGELYSGNLNGKGGTAPLTFLSKATGGLRADGFAYHPFQFNLGPYQLSKRYVALSSVSRLRSALRSQARRGRLRTPSGGTLPIYFTEFGYQVKGSWVLKPESKRANWTVAAFQLAKRSGVRSMLYYHLVRSYSRRWDTGIVTSGGSEMAPFSALVRARRGLVGF
jgi:hypothetical protein